MLQRLRGGRAIAWAAVLGGLMLLGTSREVRAGIFEIQVIYGPVNDTVAVTPGVPVDFSGINADLAAAGANFQFAALGASSTSPVGNPGTLTQTGTLLSTGAHPFGNTLTVNATDTDYFTPQQAATMFSSSSVTFTNITQGDNTAFTSWFNPSNAPLAMEVPSPTETLTAPATGKGPFSLASPTDQTNLPPGVNLYSLTNQTLITMVDGTPAVPSSTQFTGSTTVTAVPEPATVMMMLSALPLAAFGWMRRRSAKV